MAKKTKKIKEKKNSIRKEVTLKEDHGNKRKTRYLSFFKRFSFLNFFSKIEKVQYRKETILGSELLWINECFGRLPCN